MTSILDVATAAIVQLNWRHRYHFCHREDYDSTVALWLVVLLSVSRLFQHEAAIRA